MGIVENGQMMVNELVQVHEPKRNERCALKHVSARKRHNFVSVS